MKQLSPLVGATVGWSEVVVYCAAQTKLAEAYYITEPPAQRQHLSHAVTLTKALKFNGVNKTFFDN